MGREGGRGRHPSAAYNGLTLVAADGPSRGQRVAGYAGRTAKDPFGFWREGSGRAGGAPTCVSCKLADLCFEAVETAKGVPLALGSPQRRQVAGQRVAGF